jgi:hypothetical protein
MIKGGLKTEKDAVLEPENGNTDSPDAKHMVAEKLKSRMETGNKFEGTEQEKTRLTSIVVDKLKQKGLETETDDAKPTDVKPEAVKLEAKKQDEKVKDEPKVKHEWGPYDSKRLLICDIPHQLAENADRRNSDHWAGQAYRTAAENIRSYRREITSGTQMHRTVAGVGKGVAKVIDRVLADKANPHFTTADGKVTWYPRSDIEPPSEDEEEEEVGKPKGPSARAERYKKKSGDNQLAFLEDPLPKKRKKPEAVKEEKEEGGSRKKKGKGASAA